MQPVAPLHERSDVFDEISNNYHGGNDLELVQAEFRGACRLLVGTAIPKGHEDLTMGIGVGASNLDMTEDKVVKTALAWVEHERVRHGTPASVGAHTTVREDLPAMVSA